MRSDMNNYVSMTTKTKNSIIAVVALIAVAGIAFYGGMSYQKSHPSFARGQFGSGTFEGRTGTPGAPSFGAAQRGGVTGGIAGQILSKDATTFTVSTTGGGSKIVLYTASTTVARMVPATTDDLTVGTYAMVTGTTNQDGSVSAANVRVSEAPQR
jgi:hypothetical protein